MTITITLEGPMQAWGDHSTGNFKDTCLMPTKSGIVGLIGAAAGIRRGDPKLAEISSAISIAIRADRAGSRMRDYHTVDNGDKTEETYREYIQDACFLVAIEGEDSVIEEIAAAFDDPKWILYLGRKACLPSAPIVAKKFDGTLQEAVKAVPLADRHDKDIFCEMDSDSGYWKNDELLGHRTYGKRMVSLTKLDF